LKMLIGLVIAKAEPCSYNSKQQAPCKVLRIF
jgi:hypothetical protein